MRSTEPEQTLADVICQTLFHKTASIGIPRLGAGTIGSCCGLCYHFQINQSDRPWLDRGVDIVGLCTLWNEHTSAHKVCPGQEEGDPDVR